MRKVWSLDAETRPVSRRNFDHLLELPLWSSVPPSGMLFDVTPMEVIRDPNCSPYQTLRLEQVDTVHPMDYLVLQGQCWILDGVHRLAKHFVLDNETVQVRFHDESIIPDIKVVD